MDLYKYYLKNNCAVCGKKITKDMLNNQKVLDLELVHSLDDKGSWDIIWGFKFCSNGCFKVGIKKLIKQFN